jgi:hypothetical protein
MDANSYKLIKGAIDKHGDLKYSHLSVDSIYHLQTILAKEGLHLKLVKVDSPSFLSIHPDLDFNF